MKYSKFSDIQVRLQTFAGWRNNIDKLLLAQSGFFYIGGKDTVSCFHCGKTLHSFEPEDVVDREHLKYSPTCKFIQSKLQDTGLSNLDVTVYLLDLIHTIIPKINYVHTAITQIENDKLKETVDEVDDNTSVNFQSDVIETYMAC